MYVCMYVCMHICMCRCMYVCIYIYIYIHTQRYCVQRWPARDLEEAADQGLRRLGRLDGSNNNSICYNNSNAIIIRVLIHNTSNNITITITIIIWVFAGLGLVGLGLWMSIQNNPMNNHMLSTPYSE